MIKDYPQALKWLKLAAAQNNQTAQLLLGVMYQDGLGVQQNLNEAKRQYAASASQGNVDAKRELELLTNPSKKPSSTTSNYPSAPNNLASNSDSEFPYEAVISCLILGQTPAMPFTCFTDRGSGTQLEVRSGNEYNMYTAFTMQNVGTRDAKGSLVIKLRKHFEVNAQNAAESMILNIKIVNAKTDDIVYQKSAGQYRTIRISN